MIYEIPDSYSHFNLQTARRLACDERGDMGARIIWNEVERLRAFISAHVQTGTTLRAQIADDARNIETLRQTVTDQTGAVRSAEANAAALRAEIEQQWRPMLKTAQEAQNAAIETHNAKHDALHECRNRVHALERERDARAADLNQYQAADAERPTLHDRYVMAALNGILARPDFDPQISDMILIVGVARNYADIAVAKKRNEA